MGGNTEDQSKGMRPRREGELKLRRTYMRRERLGQGARVGSGGGGEMQGYAARWGAQAAAEALRSER